jgi:hypothetical protein
MKNFAVGFIFKELCREIAKEGKRLNSHNLYA